MRLGNSLRQFAYLFALDGMDLDKTSVVKHTIKRH